MKKRMPSLKIRSKLIATLSVPLLVLALVVGAEVQDRRAEVRENQETKELIELVQLAARARNNVQVDQALAALPRSPEVARQSTTSRARTIADVDALSRELEGARPARFGPAFEQSATRVAGALDSFRASRTRGPVDAGLVEELTSSLVELGYVAGRSIDRHGDLARRTLGFAALNEYWEKQAELLVTIAATANGRPAPQAAVEGIAAARVEAGLARELFETTATDEDASALETLLQENDAIEADLHIRTAEATRIDEVMPLEAVEVFPPMERTLRQLGTYVDGVGDGLTALAERRSSDAASAATWFVAIAIGATLLALALALLLLLSMGRRLDKLVTGAQTMAERQLPAMVEGLRHAGGSESVVLEPELLEGLGDDEIGELGNAFNAVQRAFVEVASDQAELLRKGIGDIYVRLARRNQSLVERQIALLDRLEAIEKDPDILENLFRLDHLATRIRRNAESLLVLAGTEPSRKWTAPVSLSELLRAATAEVEDYSRIHVASGDDSAGLMVPGSAALHLTHLFAELIENAVQFSPPGTVVEIVTRRRESSYSVYVTDTGMGMNDEQLAEANELLANPPEAGLDLSRTLGLYVVARLAARYGASVRLARSAYDGIVASVALPKTLVSEAEHPDEPAPRVELGSADPGHANGDPGPIRLPVRVRPEEDGDLAQAAAPAAVGTEPEPASPNGEHAAPAPTPALPKRSDHGPAESPARDHSVGLAPSTVPADERRSRLARFRHGLEQGRRSAAHAEPTAENGDGAREEGQ